jgi:diadenosine tetraphosphate (Ap4A) HIT family hydrolase
MEREWPKDWNDRKRGADCPMCADMGAERKKHGVRIFDGRWSDAYVGRFPVRPGYVYVIWKGRHVAEPTELSEAELTAYWRELLTVARALAAHYAPAQINYEIYGNSVPHLHTHVQSRFLDDSGPGRPLDWSDRHQLPGASFEADVKALRALLAGAGDA